MLRVLAWLHVALLMDHVLITMVNNGYNTTIVITVNAAMMFIIQNGVIMVDSDTSVTSDGHYSFPAPPQMLRYTHVYHQILLGPLFPVIKHLYNCYSCQFCPK